MWRLTISELVNKFIYRGQRLLFLGTIKASVKNIYVRGQRVQSGFFNASTKPIFRSESARFILYVQMSREMWDFDAESSGEIMFSKVINGFLPELFKRWQQISARHLVTIVLFTRVEYERGVTAGFVHPQTDNNDPSIQTTSDNTLCKDFFRVVVSDTASGEWAAILLRLKKEFKVFLRDILIRKSSSADYAGFGSGSISNPSHTIAGRPTAAIRGNILEAINLASSQFSSDYIDRDLVRTGISIVVITPGTGLFEVDYDMLTTTTDKLIENGIWIDLISLSRMPLHSIPLFKYKMPQPRSLPNNRPTYGIPDSRLKDEIASSNDTWFGYRPASDISVSHHSHQSGASHRRLSNSDLWNYGIPHWIDVSFWTSPSTDDTLQVVTVGNPIMKSSTTQSKRKSFVPRARMYELQMMGVMENAMNAISIPYLPHASNYPQDILRAPSRKSKAEALSPPSILTYNSENIRLDVEELNRSRLVRSVSDISSHDDVSKHSKIDTEWMDRYDDLVFRDPLQNLAATKPTRGSASLHKPSTNQLYRDINSPLLGSSPSTRDFSSSSRRESHGKSYLERGMDGMKQTQGRNSRKVSIASSTSIDQAPPTKPTRLSRQISFGLRGFNVAAPKATASTELSSEYAKSASPLTRGPRSQPSVKAHDGVQTTQSETIATLTLASPKLSQDDTKHLEAISPSYLEQRRPSRPINIRNITPSSKNEQLETLGSDRDFEPSQSLDKLLDPSPPKHLSSELEHSSGVDVQQPPTVLSPSSAMNPWLTVLNPSNPHKTDEDLTHRLGRWQHIFPRPLRASSIKWKSLCSPAAVPLTTEEFPTFEQLRTEYQESLYRVWFSSDSNVSENPKTRDWLVREIIGFRLSHGFQIVVGTRLGRAVGELDLKQMQVFDGKSVFEDGTVIFMSRGSAIHRLSCVDTNGVEIKRLIRRPIARVLPDAGDETFVIYKPAIRTQLGESYEHREIVISSPRREELNWNSIDNFLAGHEQQQFDRLPETLRFWRARFVLVPVDPPSSTRRPLHSLNEDNEEEIRLEGLRKLTQMWQRFRHVLPDDRRFQASVRKPKDTNPLDIEYHTSDPSKIVAAKMDSTLSSDNELIGRPVQLLPETELFQRSALNLSSLAQTIQSDKGIRMMDRRWHLRLHYNCFIGFEFTSWCLENFKDIDKREEAVELGNELMKGGLFEHVEQRHNFRDGNFFYQIASQYRTPRPESRSSWFGARKPDKSVPSTPIVEGINKSSSRPSSQSNHDGSQTPDTSTPTPTKTRPGVALSRSLRYDVDYRKRSFRPEIINLHYDRVHHPDNCYHIRIDWMNVTSKLIEDAIVSWATASDKFGIRLVEVPIAEASAISSIHPFRAPYVVKLAQYPPKRQPQQYFDATSFDSQFPNDDKFYQKAILKKFNFVLDLEAATDFPPNVEVTYSWGKPDYRYSQYIHRSGVLLAQINDQGDFLILANRLYNNRSAATKDANKLENADLQETESHPARFPSAHESPRISPFTSPLVRATLDISAAGGFAKSGLATAFATPGKIKQDLEAFCEDAAALDQFYGDLLRKTPSPGPNTPFMESSIPTLGLPPSLTLREGSASPKPSASAGGLGEGKE